jgi:dTMP kinase
MTNAKLIVLEGLDGSGKSTQIDIIKKYFESNNLKYEYLHFPIYGHNEASKDIAAYLRGEYGNVNDVNPVFVANIYAMDRFLYLPTLQKQLLENDVVLLDRYVFSNMAFQGAKYNSDAQSKIMRDWIEEFEFGFLELPYPDLNLFLDVPIAFIEERLNIREKGDTREYLDGKKDIHEGDLDLQRKVRHNYLDMFEYDNYYAIDCARFVKCEGSDAEMLSLYTPEELFERYRTYIDNVLFNKPITKNV